MAQEKGFQIVLASRPEGKVTLENFRAEEFSLPQNSRGEFLLKVNYLSLDPYMRGRMDDRKSYADPLQIGEVMRGESVSTVLASNHPDYEEGNIVLAHTGWRTHAVANGDGVREINPGVVPVTTRLGVPGHAWFHGIRGNEGDRKTGDWRDCSSRCRQRAGRFARRTACKNRRGQGGWNRRWRREMLLCKRRASVRRRG